jgi:hypothetical protein
MKILGDTHIGRRFINAVPLHRRGEREGLIRAQFRRGLDPGGSRLHVHMGDVFDASEVGYADLLFVSRAYLNAARSAPDTLFVVLRGNHDKSRDLTATCAFEVFRELVRQQENILVVEDHAQANERFAFFGWCPDKSAEELVAEARAAFAFRPEAVFGHWDVDTRSDPFNLIPTKLLADWEVKKAYTGHVHLPDQFTRDGVDVTVTGSMVPLAHGEDPTGDWYVTLRPDEITDPAVLRNKCVRIILAPGEVWDQELDCLQLKIERVGPEEQAVEVSMDGFDLNQSYQDIFASYSFIPQVKDRIDAKWQETFTSAG